MCCLFGLIDYKNTMTIRDKEKLIRTLSIECEERGTDATGVAYIENGAMKIFKKPLPAHKIKFHFKTNPKVIMGHTRMTTQGSEKKNYNNHPFLSETLGFSLAHNGVLYNDNDLRKSENLPDTKIETDSFIAVQLIEQKGTLAFKTIANMAEKVLGSFCFTILSKENELYIVKGDNPMAIAKVGEVYIYASTNDILKKALSKMKMYNYDLYSIDMGKIVRFEGFNKISTSEFNYQNYFDYFGYYDGYCNNRLMGYKENKEAAQRKSYNNSYYFVDDEFIEEDYETAYIDSLLQYARSIGFDESIIENMLDEGYDYVFIEDVLYDAEAYMRSVQNKRETKKR